MNDIPIVPAQIGSHQHSKGRTIFTIVLLLIFIPLVGLLAYRFMPQVWFDMTSERVVVVDAVGGMAPAYREIYWSNSWSVIDGRSLLLPYAVKRQSVSAVENVEKELQKLNTATVQRNSLCGLDVHELTFFAPRINKQIRFPAGCETMQRALYDAYLAISF